ncbi:Rv3654c family TadE-like protein [Knoellia subterranea]|uniref:Membrane protein n=1 Tax=Knoellia subterranea KCTC 19937 TaxID=1385521 RepID=A0A0A0JPZ3_9MICO|nr:Rv3654c family TadE-like protein [Knoellia subterranea]KGN38102.1 membrane protein [Knoellia subterranea KCTC 19937]
MRAIEERGSGSVLVVAAIGILLVLVLAGMQIGVAGAAAHRARGAADLAALAGAGAQQQGADPCAVAERVARSNGAELVSCAPGSADSLRVRVSCPLSVSWPGVPATAVASARAGPSDATETGMPPAR